MADTKLSQLTLKTGDMVASDLVEITEGGNTTKSVTGTKILGFVSANITGITTSQADAIVANTAKTGITSGQANAITANTAKVTNATHTGEVTGATALTIADNVVDEANLKVSNTPTNGYALTAQSGNTGGLTWAETAAAAGSSSIVTTGALNSGSITSGFGSINNGASTITTTGVVSGVGSGLTALNGSNISSGTVAAARVATLNQNTTGSAATLTTARTIAGVSFNGSANISLNNNAITNGAGYTTNTMSTFNVKEGNGGETVAVTNGETIHFEQGTGMQVELTSASGGGQLTFTNTSPNVVQTTVTGSSGSCTGNAATATQATKVTVTNSNSSANYPVVWHNNSNRLYDTVAKFYFRPNTGSLTLTGNITAYSDSRVKSNIEVIPNALEKVSKLSGYTFDRTDLDKDEDGNDIPVPKQTGVIAQEVLNVLPEVVTKNDDGMYSVAYGNMVGLLIEAIKELKAEVEELKGNK